MGGEGLHLHCSGTIIWDRIHTSMEKEKDLSIKLNYGNDSCILNTKRSHLLSKACSKYNLNEENIEIYVIDKGSLRKTDVKSLADFAHIRIVEKPSISTNQMNGHRQTELRDTPHSTAAAISSKLKQNRITGLTTKESELLLNHLESLPPFLKRKFDSESRLTEPIMKNRKIQANPVDQKEVYTQTDALIELSNPSTSTSVANVQQEIKRYAKKEKKDPAIIADLMEKSFQDRRIDIMKNKPMVQGVRESYPLLFNIAEVRNELDRILYIGKCEEFLANVEKYADIILHMTNDKDPLLKTITEKVKGAATIAQKKYAVEVGSILMLSNLIGETRSFLKLRDTSFDPGDHPYIEGDAKINEIFFDQYTFKVYTERVLLCEASDFKEAILALMASFFIFNISYPDSSFNTLVIMEKLYLEACDTEDTDIDDNVRQIIKQIQLKFKVRESKKK
ncbi:hypothetical protein JTE90_000535 [Oedothorax gibbosus]|uniref:Uncharacterized protein n=1 Tax=Oedothorax gibbosus TaxID=931172 RepID=A0AAV6VWF8_9ARAC|nr:hypothetical protein JTE90_000535 [Oedothorax gibbosus]